MNKEDIKFLYSIAEDIGTMGMEYRSCKDGDRMREIVRALEEESSDDCVSRQAGLDAITDIDGNVNMDIYTNEVREIFNGLPPVTPTHGTCNDCKYIEKIEKIVRILEEMDPLNTITRIREVLEQEE